MNLRSLLAGGAWITIGMLAGRLLGLLRESLLAARFGLGTDADQAIALLLLPDFITAMLVGTAAGAALIPAFAARTSDQAQALLCQVLVVGVILFTSATVIIACVSPLPFALALASLPFTSATGIITAWLQYKQRFLVPAFANAVFNSGIIITLVFSADSLNWLGAGILTASLLRFAMHMAALHRSGARLRIHTPWQIERPILLTYLAATGSSICTLTPNYAIYGLLALQNDSLALFNYAFKLFLLPAMLLQNIAYMLVLPWLADSFKYPELFARKSQQVLRAGWIIALCMCLTFIIAAPQLTALCFGYGKVSENDVNAIAGLVRVAVWALPGMLLSISGQQILYGLHINRPQLIASILQTLFITPLCLAGHYLVGIPGAIAGYVAVQWLPLPVLAAAGRKHGILHMHHLTTYIKPTLACLCTFLPLAWVWQRFTLTPWEGLLAAMTVGMALLGAGAMGDHEVIQRLRQRKAAV